MAVTKGPARRARVHAPGPSEATLEPLLHGFQELGLSPYEARVLLALLRHGSGNSVELAELSGIPRTAVYPVLQGLGKRGLADRVPGPGPAAWASRNRDDVMARLKAAEEERLRRHAERADELRRLLDQSFPEAPADVPMPFVHVLPGANELKLTYLEVLREAHTEVVMFTRPASTWPFANPSQAVLDVLARGVPMRALYESAQWEDPSAEGFRAEMAVYHAAGLQARLAEDLPLTLIVVDSTVALVHMLHPRGIDGYPTTIHVEHPGFAQVASVAFESAWASATPLRPTPRVRSRSRSAGRAVRSVS